MYAHVEKRKENKSRAVANSVAQKKSDGKPTFQFVDHRPETVAQRKLQVIANNSTERKKESQLQAMMNNYVVNPEPPIQKKEVVQRVTWEQFTGLHPDLKSKNMSISFWEEVIAAYNAVNLDSPTAKDPYSLMDEALQGKDVVELNTYTSKLSVSLGEKVESSPRESTRQSGARSSDELGKEEVRIADETHDWVSERLGYPVNKELVDDSKQASGYVAKVPIPDVEHLVRPSLEVLNKVQPLAQKYLEQITLVIGEEVGFQYNAIQPSFHRVLFNAAIAFHTKMGICDGFGALSAVIAKAKNEHATVSTVSITGHTYALMDDQIIDAWLDYKHKGKTIKLETAPVVEEIVLPSIDEILEVLPEIEGVVKKAIATVRAKGVIDTVLAEEIVKQYETQKAKLNGAMEMQLGGVEMRNIEAAKLAKRHV